MQPLCSLPLSLCGPAPSLGLQSCTQKQLFEKFWKGTFKAVATPRPESVIVASITASRRVPDLDTAVCQPLKTDEGKAADSSAVAADRNGCIKTKGRKHHSRRRFRSPSFDEDLSPRPKVKKKKKKSERKRKRKRSPYDSLSPLRRKKKKKKKKKKSSKKSKRHRYSSKKSKRSSSSLKRKRKDERKHKKSSRTHSRRRRRYRRSESESSSCQSSTEDRRRLQKSVVHQDLGDLAAAGGETNRVLNHREMEWRPATKSVCKTAPKYRSVLSTSTILSSKPGSELLRGKGSQHLSSRNEGPHDYDSGNDTSSPPSGKTGVSQESVTGKKNHCQRPASPEKLKFADRDNASDSGNSVTSYASLCKPYVEEGLSATLFSGNGRREQITLGCRVEALRSPKTSSCSHWMSESPRRRLKTRSSSSRSRSRSPGSSRYSRHYSRSPSLSSCSSYSRSSYSADLRRRGSAVSLSSRGSHSRHSTDRLRDRKRSRSRGTDVKLARKASGKRRRRKSYSPLKKRRRDSPSHLEARRITSARKRPIPYFRPSPSSSSRSTSVSSWSSLFTRSRSRSLIYSVSRSRSRSRSRSYSTYRSYSRSSSWNSTFGTRSRSRSRGSMTRRKRTRR